MPTFLTLTNPIFSVTLGNQIFGGRFLFMFSIHTAILKRYDNVIMKSA